MVSQAEKDQIKRILLETKVDIAVDFDKIPLAPEVEQQTKAIWNEINAEELNIKNDPIYREIQRKISKADKGMHFDKITYTTEEQEFLDTNPTEVRIKELVEKANGVETNARKSLKERLLKGKASKDEEKAFNNAEMTIRDSTAKSLGHSFNGDEDLPMFSVDGDYYEIFNDYGDFEGMSTVTKVQCNLKQKLNEIGFDYEDEDYPDKVIVRIDKPIPKDKFVEKNQYCKKYSSSN